MVEQVRKGVACERDTKILHVGKIGLCPFSWDMDLLKNDFFRRSVQCFPACNMPPERAILGRAIAIRMAFTHQSKQRGRLKCWITFELLNNPGPIFLKRVRARVPVMGA